MNESYNEFLSTWESQQNALIEMREQRFSFMMDVIENSHSKVDSILDVGCGPGSFTIRLAEKFPQARIYSIDYDPVLLRIAKNNVSKYASRVRILEYDLKGNEWLHALDDEKFDAIVSTTALHWIPKSNLKSLYENFYNILKSGGIFMDGDHFRSNNDSEYIQNLYSKIRDKISGDNLSREEAMNWDQWWKYIADKGVFSEELMERSRRYTSGSHDQKITLEDHIDILNRCGFDSVGIIWQYLDNRVLFSRK